MFAAPDPNRTITLSASLLSVSFSAFIRAASEAPAVPCWSSCHTGIFMLDLRSSSIWKHLGDSISSRFIPPNAGSSAITVCFILAASCVPSGIGTALTPPRYLNMSAFPSKTGRAASPPMFPSPRTRLPSPTTAIVFHLPVNSNERSLFLLISMETAATPGVYQ